jgi:hypothetical protein
LAGLRILHSWPESLHNQACGHADAVPADSEPVVLK